MERYIFIYSVGSGIIENIPGVLAKAAGGRSSCALCTITHGPIFEKVAWGSLVKSLNLPAVFFHRNEIPASVHNFLTEKKIPLPVVLKEGNDEHLTVVIAKEQLESCDGSVECVQKLLK